MKRICRISSVLLLLTMLVMVLPLTVLAESQSFNGTVDNKEEFWFHQNYDDEVESAQIENGAVPGMSLRFPNPAAVTLSGVPTQAGSYTLYVSVYTQSGEWLQYTLNISIKKTPEVKPIETTASTEAPAATEKPEVNLKPTVSALPNVTKDPTGETVVEGESAVFIARADRAKKYTWEILVGDKTMNCSKLPDYLGTGLTVSGTSGEKLVISNIPKELDGAKVRCKFTGNTDSVYSAYAKITVIEEKDATPEVTKNPTGETVEEGAETSFVAKAKYAQKYTWKLVAPDGTKIKCKDAPDMFAGLKVSGSITERVTLTNIPLELDGYQIFCEFTAGSTVSSDKAKIHVTPLPTQAPTTAPSETAATEQTVAPTVVPETEIPAQTEPTVVEKPDLNTDEEDSRDNTALIITIIVSVTIVVVAAIAAVVVLKLKGQNGKFAK